MISAGPMSVNKTLHVLFFYAQCLSFQIQFAIRKKKILTSCFTDNTRTTGYGWIQPCRILLMYVILCWQRNHIASVW